MRNSDQARASAGEQMKTIAGETQETEGSIAIVKWSCCVQKLIILEKINERGRWQFKRSKAKQITVSRLACTIVTSPR